MKTSTNLFYDAFDALQSLRKSSPLSEAEKAKLNADLARIDLNSAKAWRVSGEGYVINLANRAASLHPSILQLQVDSLKKQIEGFKKNMNSAALEGFKLSFEASGAEISNVLSMNISDALSGAKSKESISSFPKINCEEITSTLSERGRSAFFNTIAEVLQNSILPKNKVFKSDLSIEDFLYNSRMGGALKRNPMNVYLLSSFVSYHDAFYRQYIDGPRILSYLASGKPIADTHVPGLFCAAQSMITGKDFERFRQARAKSILCALTDIDINNPSIQRPSVIKYDSLSSLAKYTSTWTFDAWLQREFGFDASSGNSITIVGREFLERLAAATSLPSILDVTDDRFIIPLHDNYAGDQLGLAFWLGERFVENEFERSELARYEVLVEHEPANNKFEDLLGIYPSVMSDKELHKLLGNKNESKKDEDYELQPGSR